MIKESKFKKKNSLKKNKIMKFLILRKT